MRVTVLHAPGAAVGAIAGYYAAAAYYTDPDEPPGRWWGRGTAAVGLESDVDAKELELMLDARHPHSGDKVGRGYGPKSARGFDATFSAPKSMSVLWALADDPATRQQVLAAHDAAVTAALGWIEMHGNVTRRGTDGVHQVDAQGLTVAVFRQHTSRALDPQLHTHAVIWGKVQDGTGKWLALDARWLLRQQRSISWVYDAALRTELQHRLGVSWGPVPDGAGQSEIVGVPETLLEVFSQRTRQVDEKLDELIERWSAENDGAEPDTPTIYDLERRAAQASRPNKAHGIDINDLRHEWATRAGTTLRIDPAAPTPVELDRDTVIGEALDAVAESSATWLQADIAREIAARLPAGAAWDATGLVELVDSLAREAAARCVELHPPAEPSSAARTDGRPTSEHVTDRLLSSRPVLEQEDRLVRWGRGWVEETPAASVADAVAGLDYLVLVVGPAGAGKTTAIKEAVARLRANGREVLGLAPSGKAADVLATTAGCPATTLAKLLHDANTGKELPPNGTTIVLDEAGMARTQDLDHLVRLARPNWWRLICVGDPEQLPAVGRGGMFAHWCDTLPTHELRTLHRFEHQWEADASLALRSGHPEAAKAYTDHGRVQTLHPALVARSIATSYLNVAARGDTIAITTATAATARTINIAIQRRLHPAGPSVGLGDGTVARVGDRVATRRNNKRLGVRNRHTWDVTAIGPNGSITVTDPARGSVVLPARYVAEHVELGWAVTGYGSQGVTVDRGICVVEPASTRAGIYVGLTRGRDSNHAVIVDGHGTTDPEEALAVAIARPANATTALDTRQRLHQARGIEPAQLDLERDARSRGGLGR